jgi:hypothetical protein
MSTWLRLNAATALAGAIGVILLAGPAAAEPSAAPSDSAAAPAEVDSRILLLSDDGDSPVAPGGSITYAISTADLPENVPQHKTVTLELPAGVTFRSAADPQAAGPCVPDAGGATVTCTTTDPQALRGSWRVTTDVADDAPLGEFLVAKATLRTEIPDPEQENNVSTVQVFVTTGGDMSVAIAAEPGPWTVGESFDATITVHNFGPYRSPARLTTWISSSTLKITGWPQACQGDPGEMDCPLEMVEAGATRQIKIRVRVTELDKGYLELRPILEPTAPDTDEKNNTATYRADIVAPAAPGGGNGSDDGGGDGNGDGEAPSLPITGAPAGMLALAGLGLIVAGAAARRLARHQR